MLTAPSIVRPAVAAIVLLAVIALTGVVLYAWWPGGVALGIVVGAGSMLVVGGRMQRSNARVPSDEALQQRLGIPLEGAAMPAAPVRVVAPAPVREALPAATVVEEPVAVAPLAARPDDAFFTTSAAPVPGAAVEQPVPAPVAVPADDAPDTIPSTDFVLNDEDDDERDDREVRADLEALKDELGDDYLDFARAARLVVSTQYASAARLQRDLEVPYSRARRLLSDLEERHFVGPATGSLPRVVLMPKDRLPEVERLLTEA